MPRSSRYSDDPQAEAEPEQPEQPTAVDPETAAKEAHRDKVVGDLQARQQAIKGQMTALQAQHDELEKQVEAAREAATAPTP